MGPKVGLRGGEPQEDAADAVEGGEQALVGEKFVGHQADEKGREHGAKRGGAAARPICSAGEVQLLAEPSAERDVPSAPNEIFEEHHCGQPESHLQEHAFTSRES